jgi:CubicO group peptidase (beta-lactamase class C family)
MVEIHGTVADGFEAVRDAFAANFEQHGEVGAQFVAYFHGEQVVDLWGGTDPANDREYTPDLLQLVFSSTKGVVAIAAHLLVQRGLLDLEAPVARYWPEFAEAGKADITLRTLLSHRAGLVGLDESLTLEEFCDWDTFTARLAAQAPLWEPGTAHGYHALTFGHLVGEVIRRVTGQSVGDVIRQELCARLGVEFEVGLSDADLAKVAPLIDFDLAAAAAADEPDPLIMAILTPGSLTNRAFLIAPVLITTFNEPQLLQAQIPSANGCTNARSLAKLYAATVSEVDGVRLLDPATTDTARQPQSDGTDLVLLSEDHMALGFFLPDALAPLLGPGSFGHPGMGGSLGAALPERELAFGYVMNQCLAEVRGDPRTQALAAALLACTA